MDISCKNIVSGITPKEATKEDIRDIVRKFGDAALRAKKLDLMPYKFMQLMVIY